MNSLICKGEISWPDPQKYKIKISKEMKNFIERLLDKDPECRLGAKGLKEVFSHKWFKGVNFDKLIKQKAKAPYIPQVDVIDEEKEDDLLSTYQRNKKKANIKSLMETNLTDSRKKMIRDKQKDFSKF